MMINAINEPCWVFKDDWNDHSLDMFNEGNGWPNPSCALEKAW